MMIKSNFDEKLLLEILSIQSNSEDDSAMMKYLRNKIPQICKTANIVEDAYGNIYVTKGKTKYYPCLVSHTDTVHTIHKDFKVYEQGGIAFAFSATETSQVGVGGDDKCGILVCLNALKDMDAVKLVFFRKEEVGCLGSKEAVMDFFDNCSFVGQADRRGHEGFVTIAAGTELSSKEFIDAVDPILKQHQYKPITGSITDVMTLKRKGLKVCAFNIECGYYYPHSNGEVVIIENLEDCYNTIIDITNLVIQSKKQWLHTYEAPKQEYFYNRGSKHKSYGYQTDMDFTWDTRKDVVNRRKFSHFSDDKNLISDDPTAVNSFLNEQEDERRAVLSEDKRHFPITVSPGDVDEADFSESEIELWENVMLAKSDYDEAMQEFEAHMLKKAELAGRL